jgi:hypothetical protein
MGLPAAMLADQGEAERARLVGDGDAVSDRQRACLVGLADERALLDERLDVLEDRDLADADLVGQLLHRRGIAPPDAPVADELKDASVAWVSDSWLMYC